MLTLLMSDGGMVWKVEVLWRNMKGNAVYYQQGFTEMLEHELYILYLLYIYIALKTVNKLNYKLIYGDH